MDPGTGNDAVAAIGGSLILVWFLTPVLLVLLLTWMFLLRSPGRRPGGADEKRPPSTGPDDRRPPKRGRRLPSQHAAVSAAGEWRGL